MFQNTMHKISINKLSKALERWIESEENLLERLVFEIEMAIFYNWWWLKHENTKHYMPNFDNKANLVMPIFIIF